MGVSGINTVYFGFCLLHASLCLGSPRPVHYKIERLEVGAGQGIGVPIGILCSGFILYRAHPMSNKTPVVLVLVASIFMGISDYLVFDLGMILFAFAPCHAIWTLVYIIRSFMGGPDNETIGPGGMTQAERLAELANVSAAGAMPMGAGTSLRPSAVGRTGSYTSIRKGASSKLEGLQLGAGPKGSSTSLRPAGASKVGGSFTSARAGGQSKLGFTAKRPMRGGTSMRPAAGSKLGSYTSARPSGGAKVGGSFTSARPGGAKRV